MNILELRVQGFARVSAIEIRPDGALVPITGRNRQGKTTILKAIWSLVKGRAAAPPVAINKDAEEAVLYGDFGAFKVTRTITRDAQGGEDWKIKVVDADGRRIGAKPQAMLDGWLGALTLDPLEFARMDAKKQFDQLRALVPGFDFVAEAKERQGLYQDRTDANRALAQAQARADGVSLPPGPEPKPVDTVALLDDLQKAERANAAASNEEQRRNQVRANIDIQRDEAENMRAKAAGLEKMADEREAELNALATIPDQVDTEAMRRDMAVADRVRQVIALHQSRRDHLAAVADHKGDSERLDKAIADIDARKVAAITAAKLPVAGLTLGDEEVLMNGVPLAQASTMEKIMVGVSLGMAMNPDLKVITLDEASELDSDALADLCTMAEKSGFQVWYTRVDESGECGFVIEDGKVANIGGGL